MNVKGKFLKEIESAIPVNTRMIRKQHNPIADEQKVLLFWIEDQTCYNIPPSQSLTQSETPALLNSLKTENGDKATEGKFEAARDWLVRFKERRCLHNNKVQGKAVLI